MTSSDIAAASVCFPSFPRTSAYRQRILRVSTFRMCRDDCRTVVAPAFAAKNFRHLAGTKAKARWNASTTDAPTEPTATHGAAAAKWDPRRVGFYRGRFQEETACLSRG